MEGLDEGLLAEVGEPVRSSLMRNWVIAAGRGAAQLERPIARRDRLLSERDRRIAALETEIMLVARERESTVREREARILELELEIRRVAAEREATILEREGRITTLEGELARVEATALRFEARLAALERREAAPRGRAAAAAPPAGTPVMASAATADPDDSLPRPDEPAGRALARWQATLSRFDPAGLQGGQTPIDPYILERTLHCTPGRLLIATQEGRDWFDNVHQTEAWRALSLGMIRPGDTVLDCGANQGVNSLVYSRIVGPPGQVVGFDPFALNIAIARFNAALNGADNIAFVQAGLGGQRSTAVVSQREQCAISLDGAAGDQVEITLVPLDDYAHLRPDFVKIDIEGAEVDALAGASALLAQRPCMYIEIHPGFLPRFGRAPMDLFRFVSLDDYRCYIDYPGLPYLQDYRMEFEITQSCALYLVPRDRPPLLRHYRG